MIKNNKFERPYKIRHKQTGLYWTWASNRFQWSEIGSWYRTIEHCQRLMKKLNDVEIVKYEILETVIMAEERLN